MTPTGAAGPGASEARRDQIVTWHARGHDALDRYGIPRFADGLEYTVAERVVLLAARGKVPEAPKPALGPQGSSK